MKTRSYVAALGLALAVAAAPGCAGDDLGTEVGEATELIDLYRDGKDLDLGDLLSVTAGFATEELNDALRVSDFGSIELVPTELYALSETARDDATLHDIDALVSGLSTRFGERELTTEVNRVRRDHLSKTGDEVYAESAFRVALGHGWSHPIGGFDGVAAQLGFDAHTTLEARVISAFGSEWNGTVKAPLQAVGAARGFVLPRSLEDLRRLKPGESYALRGHGQLGVNLGVGVPIMIAAIDALTYNLVLSAGVRAVLEGEVDLQVVRLDDGGLVVDVGVERSNVKQARVALTDGWGVQGLLQQHVRVGSLDIDLGRLVEKAIEKQLNDKLSLVEASYEKTKRESRISVARFRLDLERVGEGSPAEAALEQLLHADLRLAQALANRAEPGIEQEFELTRSGVSSASYAGIDILGMSFFRKVVESQGSIVIQTPGGARSIFFESLHRQSGWFFSSHGYTRVGLSGMVFDAARPEGALGEANLLFQVVEGDEFMERDKLLDHLDGVILGVGGPKALAAIEKPSNELERFVEKTCPNSQAFDPCRETVLTNPKVLELRAQGAAALAAAVADLDGKLAKLVTDAGALRLAAQAAYEPKAQFVGPATSVVLDYRLDDGALERMLLERSGQDVSGALLAYLRAAETVRIRTEAEIAADRKAIDKDYGGLATEVAETYAGFATRYRNLVDAEDTVLARHPELGALGGRAIEIRFALDSKKGVKYEETLAGSLAQARSRVATAMVDQLIGVIDDGGTENNPEGVLAYTLLSLTPRSRVDLRLDVDMDLGASLAQSFKHYKKAGYANLDVYGRGPEASPIDGGLFDIDALLNVNQ
jgi:hypothetical protein